MIVTVLWTAYLAVMLILTYTLISDDIRLIAFKKLDTNLSNLAIVGIMWAVWYMWFLH